jgi:hypothetical protein
MATIFELLPQDLSQLSDQKAVESFRKLLLAEAYALGLNGAHAVDASSKIDVPDGGIDATFEAPGLTEMTGIVRAGRNFYQVKTGNFVITQRANVKKILFKETAKTELHPRVEACFEAGGTLHVVLFGYDNPERQDQQVLTLFLEELKNAGYNYSNPQIELVTQNKLVSYYSRFPSLVLDLKGLHNAPEQAWASWGLHKDMQLNFHAGAEQIGYITTIQTAIRQSKANGKGLHIRVLGEPGIGKSRMVLESTRAEDLSPLVVYYQDAANFAQSNLLGAILRDDSQIEAILVIDECDQTTASRLWNQLENLHKPVCLITIHHNPDTDVGWSNLLQLSVLDEEKIVQIFLDHGNNNEDALRYAPFCSGSPRVAHMLGRNLIHHPTDLLKPMENVAQIWDRFIAGDYYSVNSVDATHRRTVLMHLALFRQVGMTGKYEVEFQTIVTMLLKIDLALNKNRVSEIISQLKRARILQGQNTLYITPKLLQIKLWCDWWKAYGDIFNLEIFLEPLPSTMKQGFLSMFRYARESQAATKTVDWLLSADGPFKNLDDLDSSLGSDFFLALTETDPTSALQTLQRTFAGVTRERLKVFITGRRNIVNALERIGMWRDLFAGATRILLALAEAENETWSNNASGVFEGFFSLAYGGEASTEAPPFERYPVLQEALASDSLERQLLALGALGKALGSIRGGSRSIGAEHQGLRAAPELWHPKTYGELYDTFREAWKMVIQARSELGAQSATKATEILLKQGSNLLTNANLAPMVIDTFENLAKENDLNLNQELIKLINRTLVHFKDLDAKLRERLNDLQSQIEGSDFSSRMHRWVGLPLFEDNLDEDGNVSSGKTTRGELQIKKLIDEVLENPSLLIPELSWLVTSQAQNGHLFGYRLSERDSNSSFYPALLDAQRQNKENGTTSLLGGYLRAVHDHDAEKWEMLLDNLVNDPALFLLVPEITARSGLTDRTARRTLHLIQANSALQNGLSIFRYSQDIKHLSPSILHEWITYLLLLGSSEPTHTALNLFYTYYSSSENNKELPVELALSILGKSVNAGGSQEQQALDDYQWVSIATKLYQQKSDAGFAIVDLIFKGLQDRAVFSHFDAPVLELLDTITKSYPKEVWQQLLPYLPGGEHKDNHDIIQWLHGENHFGMRRLGALDLFPPELLFAWLENDVEERAWRVAYGFVFPTLAPNSQGLSFARELLVRYGERDDVQRNLMANFDTGGWMGNASDYYAGNLEGLNNYRKTEQHPKVLTFIDQYSSVLKKRIEESRIEEERGL